MLIRFKHHIRARMPVKSEIILAVAETGNQRQVWFRAYLSEIMCLVSTLYLEHIYYIASEWIIADLADKSRFNSLLC